MNWRGLYERARAHGDSAAGYYNDNIRVDTPDGPVIVRIPIHGADMMDLRLWREDRVLAAIARHVRAALACSTPQTTRSSRSTSSSPETSSMT